MKERIVWLMIMVMCLVGSGQAMNILLCSRVEEPVSHGGPATGDHEDDSLVAWLESLGHTVDTTYMEDQYGDPAQGPPTAGTALRAACEAADLIFFSRYTNSGDIDQDRVAWNSITTPLINNGNSAIIRGETSSTRWGWATGGHSTTNLTVTDWDLTAGGSLTMFDWTGSLAAPKGVGVFTNNVATGGVTIATFNGTGRQVWVEFPAGTDFDAANGTTNKYGVAGAKRVFFGHWGYDSNDGPGGARGKWSDYITQLYKDTLAGVIAEFEPDPTLNPPPVANAGPDQTVYDPEGLPVQLAGTASDAGSSDGTSAGWPEGIQTASWSQESGPGTATITAAVPATGDAIADILNSTVNFSAPGVYELMLQVSDIEPKDANDLVVITVRDHADDILLGHWKMDDDLLDSSPSANDGTRYANQGPLPPAVFADGAIGRAIVLDNPLASDPNAEYIYLGDAPQLDIQSVPAEFTVSAWIKTTNQDTQVIAQKGGDGTNGVRWMLRTSGGNASIITDDNSDKETATGGNVADDVWHFVLATCETDGSINIYVDGVFEDDDTGHSSSYDLSGTSQRGGLIGAGTQAMVDGSPNTDPGSINEKSFDGLIDDVRVYNYALPLDDPTYLDILELAAMGELLVRVDAGPDGAFELQPSETIPTAAVVTDNGTPGTLNYLWETVARPADSNAIFTDETAENTTVGFPDFGAYTLRLTVEDVNHGTSVSDEVTLTIISPTCADVIAAGLLLPGDISGPAGTPDCRVDLHDVASFAADFGRCNDPQDDCEDPWSGL